MAKPKKDTGSSKAAPAVKPAAPKEIFKPLPKAGFLAAPLPKAQAKAPAKRSVFDKPDPIKVDTRAPVNPPQSPLEIKREEGQAKIDAAFVTTNPKTKKLWTEPPKVKQKPATDYPDILNGGRSPYSPAKQAKIIKDTQGGKISEEQYHHAINTAQGGQVIPASIVLSSLGIPLADGMTRAVAEHVVNITDKSKRTNMLASIPTIRKFHLFAGDQKAREAFIKVTKLPPNASDHQIIEALGELNAKKPEGWNKLNPFNGQFGESYIHPLYRDFIEGPAKLGAGVAGLAYAGGKSIATRDPKYVEEALNEAATGSQAVGEGLVEMVKHPLKALQDDPLGLPLTAVTLGDSAAGRILGSEALRGEKGTAWARTPRDVELEHYATARHEPFLDPETHDTTYFPVKDKHGQPVFEPLRLNRGLKSKKPLARLLQDQYDKRIESRGPAGKAPLSSLGNLSTATRGDNLLKTKGDALLEKEVKRIKTRVGGKGEQKINTYLDNMAKAGRKISNARQVELLHTVAEGTTHAERKAYFQSQLDDLTKQIDELELPAQEALFPDFDRSEFVATRRAKADQRDALAKEEQAKADEMSRQAESGVQGAALFAKQHAFQAKIHSESARVLRGLADDVEAGKTGISDAPKVSSSKLAKLKGIQKNLEKQIGFHDKPDMPLLPHEEPWLEAARVVARHRTHLLMHHGALEPISALFRDYEPAVLVAAKTGTGNLGRVANKILDIRELMRKLEESDQVKPRPKPASTGRFETHSKGTDDNPRVAHEALADDLRDQLFTFMKMHDEGTDDLLSPGGPSVRPQPFRVPREVPKPRNPFNRGTKPGDITPSLDFDRLAGKTGRTTSKQFRTGNFAPSKQPLISDALKAQKAASSVEFVKRIFEVDSDGRNKLGVVRVPKMTNGKRLRAGDLVAHPDMYVLRSALNLRRAIKLNDGSDTAHALDTLLDTTKADNKIEDAYRDALIEGGDRLDHDTFLPGTGNVVLIPKGVDEALKADLRKHEPRGPVNAIYRTGVLYSRPGYAVRNLVQNMTQNTLEGVGPLSYYRAAKNDLPVAPGVEYHGFAGQAMHGDYTHPYSLINILGDADKLFKVVPSPFQIANKVVDAHGWRVLTDTVKHLNTSFENFARRAAYQKMAVKASRQEINEGKSALKRINVKMRGISDDMHVVLQDIADGNGVRSEATVRNIVDRLNEIQGDYQNMPHWTSVQMVAPFYRWYLFIGTLMLKLPFKYPVANQIIQGLGNIGAQARANLGQDLNEERSDTNIPLPFTGSNLRDATTVNAEYINPLTSGIDVAHDPLSVMPLFELFQQTLKSEDRYGNELTDEWGLPLSGTGKVKSAVGTAVNTILPPVKLADALLHPGQHSADSIPLVPGQQHPKHPSLSQRRHEASPVFKRPSDSRTQSAVNFLTGAGVHSKNLSGDEAQAADRSLKAMRVRQTKERQKKREQAAAKKGR